MWAFQKDLSQVGWRNLSLTIGFVLILISIVSANTSAVSEYFSDALFFTFLVVAITLIASAIFFSTKMIIRNGTLEMSMVNGILKCEAPTYSGIESFEMPVKEIMAIRISGSDLPLCYEIVSKNNNTFELPNKFDCPLEELMEILSDANPDIVIDQSEETNIERKFMQ